MLSPPACWKRGVGLWTDVCHPPFSTIASCQHLKWSKLSFPPTCPVYWLLSSRAARPLTHILSVTIGLMSVPRLQLDQWPGLRAGEQGSSLWYKLYLEGSPWILCGGCSQRECVFVSWAATPGIIFYKAHRHTVFRWSPLKFPLWHFYICLYFYTKLFYHHTKKNEKFFHLV